jgi:hypothetical protein
MTNHPNRNRRFVAPRWTSRGQIEHPNWVTVVSGLYSSGTRFDLLEPGYPLPDGCEHRWRVFVIRDDYQGPIWVLQAHKITNRQKGIERPARREPGSTGS